MVAPRWIVLAGSIAALSFSGILVGQTAQDPVPPISESQVQAQEKFAEPDCPYFGPSRERYETDASRRKSGLSPVRRLSATTESVTKMMGFVPGGSRTYNFDQAHAAGSIDSYIFADFQANGITPAPKTRDWEFVRRVTLDLTGRIPSADRVLAFVADSDPNKRAKLIDELIAKPEWVDKWTMYFGDLYLNTDRRGSTALQRFPTGRNAFQSWIKTSLAEGKPYNQMATDLIAAQSTNTYVDGPANYLVGSIVTNGPTQDIMDQMIAGTFDTFMGMEHLNCLLCHDGRGHLDSINLWATKTKRYDAWQLASYMSRTSAARTPVDPSNNNIYYWNLLNNQRNFTTDYTLNTLIGNRPARQSTVPGCKAGMTCYTVPPRYILNGSAPAPSEDYRMSLARSITGDVQFARATVNYMWAYFFGRGIVDPPNTFDPARLDPENPPPDPWTLQPSNPRLLNALAQHFIEGGFDLKKLMKEIVNSDTYQLSSRYPGQWKAEYEPYFARKFVRRLWGEEIVDAVTDATGSKPCTLVSGACSAPGYAATGWTDLGMGRPFYAMQFPDVVNTEGTTNGFLDSFVRGNRDDQPRGGDGSILQALNMMNATLLENKLALTGALASPLLTGIIQTTGASNTDAVNKLFLNILSRYPSSSEMSTALAALPAGNGAARNSAIQDLAWSLFNKVDFIFNY
ncbi:MAG: DUF1549 domain-containing protein [Candidatus Solibacter sp.]